MMIESVHKRALEENIEVVKALYQGRNIVDLHIDKELEFCYCVFYDGKEEETVWLEDCRERYLEAINKDMILLCFMEKK